MRLDVLKHILDNYHRSTLEEAKKLARERGCSVDDCVIETMPIAAKKACVRMDYYELLKAGMQGSSPYGIPPEISQHYQALYGSAAMDEI